MAHTLTELRLEAEKSDKNDVLKNYVKEFHQLGNCADFRGNSLGLMPYKGFRKLFLIFLVLWRTLRHNIHFEGNPPVWKYHQKFEEPVAKLLGADHTVPEVAVGNTLSVNNRFLLETFFEFIRRKLTGRRPTIITIGTNFPSDQVGLMCAIQMIFGSNYKLVTIEPDASGLYDMSEIERIIENEDWVDLGFLPGLCFTTGQRFDIPRITEALHQRGAIAGWDLAHSAGNYQLQLHEWNVDFATFCGYKYLNGGPGSVGGFFVHERWYKMQPELCRVSGWWGIDEDSRFNPDFANIIPAKGARSFLISNDQLFNMLGLEASLDLIQKYGQENIFKKNAAISTFFLECLKTVPNVTIITPESSGERGCQISFRTPKDPAEVLIFLAKVNCFGEQRGLNLRAAPVAYNTYTQVWRFCNELDKILNR